MTLPPFETYFFRYQGINFPHTLLVTGTLRSLFPAAFYLPVLSRKGTAQFDWLFLFFRKLVRQIKKSYRFISFGDQWNY